MSVPLPSQVCTWLPERSGYEGGPPGSSDGQWLYCLKNTQPSDRQVVWSGTNGKGIVAVVDFSGEVRHRPANPRLYEGWGRITALAHPIPVETARNDPVLRRCFGTSLQSVKAIHSDVAEAISERSGGLPPASSFDDCEADWTLPGGDWSPERLPPEAIVEGIVLNKDRVARRLGFPSPVNPTGRKQRMLNGRYPDLWCADGVVGEVKNQVTAAWGPGQLEDYLKQCDAQWPAHRWRGVLVQGELEMAPNALPRLRRPSPYKGRIEVWAVRKGRVRYKVVRLFP